MAIAVFIISTSAFADMRINPNQLPKQVREFVENTFGDNVKIIKAERENEFGTYHYEVRLSNGVEIDFDAGQQWVEIDCEKASANVPSAVLCDSIHSHIRNTYPNRQINKIERKYNGYEITLNDGREVFYNRDGKFVREGR